MESTWQQKRMSLCFTVASHFICSCRAKARVPNDIYIMEFNPVQAHTLQCSLSLCVFNYIFLIIDYCNFLHKCKLHSEESRVGLNGLPTSFYDSVILFDYFQQHFWNFNSERPWHGTFKPIVPKLSMQVNYAFFLTANMSIIRCEEKLRLLS